MRMIIIRILHPPVRMTSPASGDEYREATGAFRADVRRAWEGLSAERGRFTILAKVGNARAIRRVTGRAVCAMRRRSR